MIGLQMACCTVPTSGIYRPRTVRRMILLRRFSHEDVLSALQMGSHGVSRPLRLRCDLTAHYFLPSCAVKLKLAMPWLGRTYNA